MNKPYSMKQADAAQYVGLSDRYLRDAIKFEHLPVTKVGRLVYIKTADLEAWFDAGAPRTAA